jgi:hypothetical protein
MDEDLVQRATFYAHVQRLTLAERLGFGIHGIIFAASGNASYGFSAVKSHRSEEPYVRELSIYTRLAEEQVEAILGFNVPQLLGFDESLLVIEMTIVTRPFLLDFAGAYLGSPPYFTEEIWAEWEAKKKAQFGAKWSAVEDVLFELRRLGIHMVDVSPSNIAF